MENPDTGDGVSIIETIQASWQRLSDELWLPGHTVGVLLAMPNYTPEKACREVFQRWLDGGDDLLMPKSWATVIEIMGHIGNARLGQKIRKVLTGQ